MNAMDLLKSAGLSIAEATLATPALLGQTPGSSDAQAGSTKILVTGMQRILNRGLGWPDVKDDGVIGAKTDTAATGTLGSGWMRKYWWEVYSELVKKWQSGWTAERQRQVNEITRERASQMTPPVVTAGFMNGVPTWAWLGLVGFAASVMTSK